MTQFDGTDDPAATRPYYRLLGLRAEAGEPAGQSKLILESRSDLENSRGEARWGDDRLFNRELCCARPRHAYGEWPRRATGAHACECRGVGHGCG